MSLLRRLGILAFAAVAPAVAATPGASFQAEFVAAYCVTCHSGDEPKGGLLIAEVARARSTDEDLEQWRRASEYVASGTMPPAGVPQPTAGERERFAASVRAGLEREAPVTPPARAVARRLNRTEYLNTLRDLLAIREIRLPVTFPDDNPDLRFDTMAEGTHLSPGHLDAFQEVAIDIADRLVPLPYRSEWTSAAARGTVGQDPARTKYWTREGDERGLYFTGVNIAGWSGALWDRAFAAPASGVYRVRLKVSAEAASGADGKPLRLGFYAVNPSDYDLPKRALRADLPLVGSVEVTSESPSWIEADVLLERGESFHIYCENRLTKQYPDALVRTPGNTEDLRRLLARYLQEAHGSPEPTIRFEGMDVRGPVAPLPRQVQFLGGGPASLDRAYLESILLPLAERAFRRPLGAGEGRQLIESAIEHGAAAPAPEYAVHFGVRRILLSPQFLYRELGAGDLGEFGLASRLSYFLWSTMPDEELLRLAGDGRLSDPEVLRRQVRRMVRHPKAQQFVQHFSGQWLGGREAAAVMVCDVRHVWSELIRHGIVRSTEMFFDEILQRNLSIRSFVDSDFTYANEPMRIAWGMPGSEVDLRRLEADQRQSLLWPEPTRLDLASLGPEVPRHVASRGGGLGPLQRARGHRRRRGVLADPARRLGAREPIGHAAASASERRASLGRRHFQGTHRARSPGRPPEGRDLRGMPCPDRSLRTGAGTLRRGRRLAGRVLRGGGRAGRADSRRLVERDGGRHRAGRRRGDQGLPDGASGAIHSGAGRPAARVRDRKGAGRGRPHRAGRDRCRRAGGGLRLPRPDRSIGGERSVRRAVTRAAGWARAGRREPSGIGPAVGTSHRPVAPRTASYRPYRATAATSRIPM